jgi:hypothetical protein
MYWRTIPQSLSREVSLSFCLLILVGSWDKIIKNQTTRKTLFQIFLKLLPDSVFMDQTATFITVFRNDDLRVSTIDLKNYS